MIKGFSLPKLDLSQLPAREIEDKMGIGLSQPITSKVLHRKGSPLFRVGAAAMQGWRENMEDAHRIAFDLKNHKDSAFFGVFDGHAGDLCSPYVAENLPVYVDNVADWSDQAALTKACLDCDEAFMTDERFAGHEDGSTAAFTMITVKPGSTVYELINCNIGDSRTVLARRREDGTYEPITCTYDHKPTDAKERDRIVAAGGMVQIGRVDGQLALSRAFGDRALKVPKEGDPAKRKVCAAPDFILETAKPGDFVFLACDGIYESDVFSRESVIEYIQEALKKTDDLALICAEVLEQCLARGSKDNMTAMIVQLQDGTAYNKEGHEFVPGPYYAGKDGKKFQEAYKADAEAAGFTLEEALRMLAENAARRAAQMDKEAPKSDVDSMDVDEGSTDSPVRNEQPPIALPDTKDE